jgi:hypothetical protein
VKQFLYWLNPDHHSRLVRGVMLAVWVSAVAALLAVIVHGNIPDAAVLGFFLGGIWGLTRGSTHSRASGRTPNGRSG